jgi:hypothetical protein
MDDRFWNQLWRDIAGFLVLLLVFVVVLHLLIKAGWL